MDNELKNLLKGISLARQDGIKAVEVSMTDLMLLKRVIESHTLAIGVLEEKNKTLGLSLAKSEVAHLNRAVKLSLYC